jgi:hypothetical protein
MPGTPPTVWPASGDRCAWPWIWWMRTPPAPGAGPGIGGSGSGIGGGGSGVGGGEPGIVGGRPGIAGGALPHAASSSRTATAGTMDCRVRAFAIAGLSIGAGGNASGQTRFVTWPARGRGLPCRSCGSPAAAP